MSNMGCMTKVSEVIELLEKIKELGRLRIGGEQFPNAESCWDAIQLLKELEGNPKASTLNPITWSHDASDGYRGVAGGITIFNINYDMCRPRGSTNENCYKLYCKMPQVKITSHKSVEDAKNKAHEIYETYIRKFIKGEGK